MSTEMLEREQNNFSTGLVLFEAQVTVCVALLVYCCACQRANQDPPPPPPSRKKSRTPDG